MADVTYYVALPLLQDEVGSPVAGSAGGMSKFVRCPCGAPNCYRGAPAASARSRSAATGDPMIGEFGDAQDVAKIRQRAG